MAKKKGISVKTTVKGVRVEGAKTTVTFGAIDLELDQVKALARISREAGEVELSIEPTQGDLGFDGEK